MKTPKPKWSLPKFYRDFYVPAALANKRRKPPSERTLYKRSNAVRHFRELMATKKRPKGPRLAEDRIHTPQAMRRFHAQEMQRTGFAQVEKMASSSLGHSSVGMTANHYSDARGIAIMGLPDIFEATS